jgi:7-cyano-7-deazaguanine synthase in queuosine biosynthesis
MPRQTDLTIMYSGGLDSFISYHYALKQGFSPLCLFVDMGHPYAEKEWNAIMSIPEDIRPPVEKLKMTDLYTLISSRLHNQIIPSRNVMLATIGAMFSPRVWINALDGEQNGKEHDKSERYFEDTSKLLSFTNEAFQTETIIESPFANMSKAKSNDKNAPMRKPPTICSKFLYFQFFVNSIIFFIFLQMYVLGCL